jgi:AcrR family transcriptional regulator
MQGLYEHFPSKQELYEQVIVLRGETFRARADAALQGVRDPLDQIRVLATVYAQQFKDQPMFLPMFIRDRVHFDWGFTSRFGERIHQIYDAERQRLRVMVERLVEAGVFRPLETDFLIQVCLNLLEASLYHSHRNHPDEAVTVCVDRAMDCLLQGLGGRS